MFFKLVQHQKLSTCLFEPIVYLNLLGVSVTMLFTLFTFVAMTKYHLRKKEYVLFAYAPKGESLMVREAWKSLLKAERSHFVAGN